MEADKYELRTSIVQLKEGLNALRDNFCVPFPSEGATPDDEKAFLEATEKLAALWRVMRHALPTADLASFYKETSRSTVERIVRLITERSSATGGDPQQILPLVRVFNGALLDGQSRAECTGKHVTEVDPRRARLAARLQEKGQALAKAQYTQSRSETDDIPAPPIPPDDDVDIPAPPIPEPLSFGVNSRSSRGLADDIQNNTRHKRRSASSADLVAPAAASSSLIGSDIDIPPPALPAPSETPKQKPASQESSDDEDHMIVVPTRHLAIGNVAPGEEEKSRREYIVTEMCLTEQSYVDGLRIMHEIYEQPLRETKICTPEQCDQLFSNVGELYEIGKAFLKDLQAVVNAANSGDTTASIGAVFSRVSSKFLAYIPYCSNYDDANALLQKLKKETSSFRKFLEKQRTLHSDVISLDLLDALLITPIQRLPRYILLLADLIKSIPQDDPDYNALKVALEEIKKASETVNNNIKHRESQEKLETVVRTIIFENDQQKAEVALVTPGRTFIKEGDCQMIPYTTDRTREVKKPSHIFLFNDLLVLTRRKRITAYYNFREALDLRGCTVEKLYEDNNRMMIRDAQKHPFAYAVFDSEEIRDAWVFEILRAHSELPELPPEEIKMPVRSGSSMKRSPSDGSMNESAESSSSPLLNTSSSQLSAGERSSDPGTPLNPNLPSQAAPVRPPVRPPVNSNPQHPPPRRSQDAKRLSWSAQHPPNVPVVSLASAAEAPAESPVGSAPSSATKPIWGPSERQPRHPQRPMTQVMTGTQRPRNVSQPQNLQLLGPPSGGIPGRNLQTGPDTPSGLSEGQSGVSRPLPRRVQPSSGKTVASSSSASAYASMRHPSAPSTPTGSLTRRGLQGSPVIGSDLVIGPPPTQPQGAPRQQAPIDPQRALQAQLAERVRQQKKD